MVFTTDMSALEIMERVGSVLQRMEYLAFIWITAECMAIQWAIFPACNYYATGFLVFSLLILADEITRRRRPSFVDTIRRQTIRYHLLIFWPILLIVFFGMPFIARLFPPLQGGVFIVVNWISFVWLGIPIYSYFSEEWRKLHPYLGFP